jgi:hypothetical protein
MQVPSIPKRRIVLQGAAAGAVATMFVGFYWGGWSLSSTADKMAKEQSELAVVTVLAPVCADKFRALPDAEAKTVALSKADSWRRRAEFPKEFVTLPGETYPKFRPCECLLYAFACAEVSCATVREAVRNVIRTDHDNQCSP